MGALLPSYKTAVVNSIVNGISANTTALYAFASNPVVYSGNTPAITLDDYSTTFTNDWQLLFGKRLQTSDVVPVIQNIQWTTNTVYTQYDNTQALSNSNFYVLAPPQVIGGSWNIYKCINNANGGPSTQVPDQLQALSFTKSDGYTWRYITSITAAEYDKFATSSLAPIYSNSVIVASAGQYAGVENIVLQNGGVGYTSYSVGANIYQLSITSVNGIFSQNDLVYQSNGSANIAYGLVKTVNSSMLTVVVANNVGAFSSSYTVVDANSAANATVTAANSSAMSTNYVLSVANSTLIQIQNYESTVNNFYAGNAIYLYNLQTATAQLIAISGYTSNSLGNFVTLASAANTVNITPSITQYLISPQVILTSDGTIDPVAYSVVNTTSNSIASVVIIETGSDISWCNVAFVSNSSSVATNASAYAIVPPAGGHGFDPASELGCQGIGMAFTFSNTESNTIPANVIYNKIGILENPYTLNANLTIGVPYVTNTFSAVLQANLTPTTSFTVGVQVSGQTSGALGTVAFCNGTNISLTGDNGFANGETIVTSNGSVSAAITINSIGQVYQKALKPMYIQNISNVTRSNTTAESYKLVISI